MAQSETRPAIVRFGAFELNLRARELRKHGTRVRLPRQPFQILAILLERPGDVVTREELHQHLWPAGTFVDFEHGMNNAIKKLRAALGDSADHPLYVETLARVGYRFIAPVDEAAPASVSAEVESEAAPAALPVVRAGWVRRMAVPLGLLLVLAAGGYSTWRHFRLRPSLPARIMLAVLPFENLTGDPDQDYFSDGLTEEMITQLAGLQPERLGVIARASVMQYKRGNKPVDEIGRELGVEYVLEGSVRRSGGRVRIAAQLIQVKDQSHVWAKMFERDPEDIFSLQGDVARAIADGIQVELTPAQRTRLATARPITPETYEAYLKGQYFLSKRTTESIRKAVESFRLVLQRDPNYAPAYAALATSYVVMGSGESFPGDTFEKGRLAAKKALELDGLLAEAHAALALIAQNHDWNFEESEKEFKRAIALNPSYATARHWFSLGLAATGRFDEADAQMKQARELDPLSLIISAGAGLVLYVERHPEKAIEQLNKTLDVEPNFASAHEDRGLAYAELGKLKEATADFEASRRLDNEPRTVALFANAFARLGQKEEASRLLAELNERSKHEYVNPWCQAIVYAGLGEKDLAFQWLDKAFQERAMDLVALKVFPSYDPLRSDPRFQVLLRRMNFPP